MLFETLRRIGCLRGAIGSVLLCGLLPALAGEGDFLTPFVGVASAYDDNLFRLPDDVDDELALGESSRADWTRTTFAGLGLQWEPGRQRITANLQALDQSFQRFSYLDNTGYDTAARWNMAAGDSLTGAVDAGFNRQLGSFDNFRDPVKDPIDTAHGDLELGYLVTPEVELRAGAGLRTTTHGLDGREASNFRGSYWRLGVSRRTPLENRLGVEYRLDDGRYPEREVGPFSLSDDGYQQQEGVVTFTWQGGFTSVDGRLGYSWRRSDNLEFRDYSGPSGDLSTRYAWSPKLVLDLNVYRRLESLDDLFSSSVTTTGLSFTPVWAPTDRIVLQASTDYTHRQYEDSGLFVGAPQPKENILSYGLRASYTPRPLLTLSAGYSHSQRRSDRPGAEYDTNAFNFSVQVNL